MRSRTDSGFSLLEVLIAMVVVVVGIMGLLAVFPKMLDLVTQSRETQIAVSAVRSKLDEMRSYEFPDPSNPSGTNIFNTFNGATFTTTGLNPPASGPQGKITFLTEAQASVIYGSVPLDFNLNGKSNETVSPTATFMAFPVKVEVFWTDDLHGQRGLTLTTIIANHNP